MSSQPAPPEAQTELAYLRAALQQAQAELAGERQQRQRAEESASQLFQLTFEGAAVGLTHVALDGRFLRVNQRFCDIAGYTAAELHTLTFHDITEPEDLPADLARYQQLLAGEISQYQLEKRYRRKDGRLVWAAITVALARDGNGQAQYIIGVVEDITQRRQAEQTLAALVTTTAATGEGFFQTLAVEFARILCLRYVFVGELVAPQRVRTIAFAVNGVLAENIEYRLENTPCDNVVGHTIRVYPNDVQTLFPNDQLLKDMEAQSYLGVPLFTVAGAPLGLIVVLNDHPMVETGLAQSLLTIWAGRAASELERLRNEQALRASEAKTRQTLTLLRAILESPKGLIVFALDSQYRYTAFTLLHQQTMRALWGVTIEVGMNMLEAIRKPADRAKAQANFDRALRGEYLVLEEEYGDETRQRAFWENRYSPIFDETNQIVGLAVFVTDITARKHAEAELRLSRQIYAELIEAIDGIVWEADAQTFQMTFISQQAERLLGYPLRDWINQPTFWADHIHPADRDWAVDFCMTSTAAGQSHQFEYRMLAANGQAYWLHDAVTVIMVNGRPAKLRGIMVDITERQRAIEALRHSEERYRLVSNLISDFAYSLELRPNAPPRYEWVTNAFTRITGYTLEELENQGGALTFIHPEDQAPFQERLTRLRAGHADVREYRLLSKAGRQHWVRDYGLPAWDADTQRITHMHGAIQDITAHKQAEEAMRESETRLRALLDALPDLMFRMTDNGVFLDFKANDPATLATPAAQLIGSHASQWLPPETTALFNQHITALRATGQMQVFEYPLQMPSGEGIYEARVVSSGEHEVVAIIRNITERKRLDNEKQAFERRLLETQKLQSLGVLAGGVAHDINNLLVPILGNAALVRLTLSPDAPAYEALQQIEIAAQRASDLARQMLAYSGKGQLLIQSLNLNQLVNEMRFLLQSSISKRTHLRLHLADSLPLIEGDATQLRQVVMNLIINASDALEERAGEVRVSTQVVTEASGALKGAVIAPAPGQTHYAQLEVIDTGRGMDEATLARVFEPFFTTKAPGRGLGLSAVIGIVNSHHGALKVHSAPGRGTTFQVFFPIPTHPTPVTPPPPANAHWHGRGALLLVDDEMMVRTTTARIAQHFGFSVLSAADGPEALKLFTEHQAEITGVLLDLTMPNMSGEDVLRALRHRAANVPVIIMSGYSDQSVLTRLNDQAGVWFLQKPFTPQALQSLLQSAFPDSAV